MIAMKHLLVVLDGAGDRPCRELGGKTPLEAAEKPVMDSLARAGIVGLARIAGGLAPESDAGVFSVLGFDPFKYHVGRGALEALGTIGFRNGWLGLRANFATSDESGEKLVDRRVGRSLSTREAKQLEKEINKKIRLAGASFRFHATVGHRGVLVIKSRGLSKRISNTDPAYTVKKGLGAAEAAFEMRIKECVPLDSTGKKSAALVNEFTRKAHEVLEKSRVNLKRREKNLLPANTILLRDAETRVKTPPESRREWAIIADMPLEVGIGKLTGMTVLPIPPPAYTARDYSVRAKKTLAALKKFSFTYVHIKGPDLYGHDGDALGKRKCIEDIDKYFFKPLLKKGIPADRVLVTADHATPCSLKAHGPDPVPFLAAGKKIFGRNLAFSEKNGKKGPFVEGRELLGILTGKT